MIFWTPLDPAFSTRRPIRPRLSPSITGLVGRTAIGPVVWQSLYFSLVAGLAFLGLALFADPLGRLLAEEPEVQATDRDLLHLSVFLRAADADRGGGQRLLRRPRR